MKFIAAMVLFVTATFAFSGVAGFFTKEAQDWKFIQSVGGMRVSVEDNILNVECDVSGVKEVTVKPTMINSAMGVRKLKHKRVGKTIQLTLVTSVREKKSTTSCRPLDLSAYPSGEYSVQYLNPDGTTHDLGKIKLVSKRKGESAGKAGAKIGKKAESENKRDVKSKRS